MTKCMACCSEYVMATQDPEITDLPELLDAVTWVPIWQEKMVAPGAMAAACVVVPSCMKHLRIEKKSTLDTSAAALLDGRGQG